MSTNYMLERGEMSAKHLLTILYLSTAASLVAKAECNEHHKSGRNSEMGCNQALSNPKVAFTSSLDPTPMIGILQDSIS